MNIKKIQPTGCNARVIPTQVIPNMKVLLNYTSRLFIEHIEAKISIGGSVPREL